MARFNYAKSQATAERLIDKFGQDAVLRRPVPGVGPGYDPGVGSVTEYDCVVVDLPPDAEDLERPGSLVLQSDRKILLSTEGLAVEPLNSDRVLMTGGLELSILSIRPLQPGGVIVMWELMCRA